MTKKSKRGKAKPSAHGPRLKPAALPDLLLVISSAVVSVCTLIWILWFCRYGMDWTDEGYYLVWISNPFVYPVSHTQFGFVYHPLYEWLDGNIAALRQANVLIFFGLAWVLTSTFFKTIFTTPSLPMLPGWHCAVMTAGFAMLTFMYFRHWVSTPSYNSLALQSLMIAATGLLLMERDGARESLAGCLLLGIGGWLAFMAKPTTAIALGCCSVFYLLAVGKLTVRFLFLPIAVAVILFVGGAWSLDGSITGFIKRLEEGIAQFWLLESGHGLADVLRYDALSFYGNGPAALTAAVVVFLGAAFLLRSRTNAFVYCGTLLSALFAFFSLAIILGFLHVNLARDLGLGERQGLLLWAILFTAAFIGLSSRTFNGVFDVSRAQWARVHFSCVTGRLFIWNKHQLLAESH